MTVAEKLAKINEIKQQSLKAIQDKGGDISSATTFEGYPAAIRSIPQEITGSVDNVYSTEETVVGKWVDGKPIYRRTYIFEDGPINFPKDETVYVLDDSDWIANIDTVLTINGMSSSGNAFPIITLYEADDGKKYIQRMYNVTVSDKVRIVRSAIFFEGSDSYPKTNIGINHISIEYTKIVDEAVES